MADVTWTDAQSDAIKAQGENILVSAAAGSGKTAVLVERVIRMITREKDPLDIDRLLVMTFTKAAARQMKNKIYKAIKACLNKNPDNSYLRQQLMKVQNARICTIDSLCNEIVRDNFHAVDLDPSFRIADEAEISMLKDDVLQSVIEDEYRKADTRFMDLAEYYIDKNDSKLEDIVLRLCRYADSSPEPENWIRACTLPYAGAAGLFEAEIEYPDGMENWMDQFRKIVDIRQKEIRQMALKGLEVSSMNHGPYKYADLFKETANLIDRITDQPLDFRSPEIIEFLGNWKKAPIISKKDDVDENLKGLAQEIRKSIKTKLEDLRDNFLYADMDALCRELDACRPIAETISDVTLKFMEAFNRAKRDRLIADFSDIAHFALKIMIRYDDNGKIVRKDGVPVYTDAADIMASGIDEIIVDEYQDTNKLQEELIKALSGERFGRPNVFMVGDVKQSIYGFRMACPELFIRKMDDYLDSAAGKVPESGQYGRLIVLDRNFRSRREVLDFTNLIFRQTMIRDVGDIDYANDSHDLVYGGVYGKKTCTDPAFIPEIRMINESGEEAKNQEAYLIADKIAELTGSGKYRLSDIAILTRATDNPQLEQVLNQRGISVIKNSGKGFFDSFEIRLALNLLKIIDNPYQDIPFAAVLFSPVCGASAADLARIKAVGSRDMSLYECLSRLVSPDNEENTAVKLRPFVEKLEAWRIKASYTGLYDFVEYVLNDSGMYNIAAAMPQGADRRANLEFLKTRVQAFVKGSYTGLFNFIRYIKALRDNDIDFGSVNALEADVNAVQMMTIHKSKGLEFPVVFLAVTGKKYNELDMNSSIVPDRSIGIGIESRNINTRIIKKTALMQVIRYKQKIELYAEEMRLLYVALTRAKEKLIITGSLGSLENAVKQWETEKMDSFVSRKKDGVFDEADMKYPCLPQYRIMECSSYLKLIGMTLHRLKDSSCLFDLEYLEPEDVENVRAEEVIKNFITDEYINGIVNSNTDISGLREMFEKKYPFIRASMIQGKITASQLENKNPYENGTVLQPEKEDQHENRADLSAGRKNLYGGDGELTGAERGNAYHKFFELLDYSRAGSCAELRKQISELEALNKLTKEQAASIDTDRMLRFTGSELGKRMAAAYSSGRLFREKQFVMGYYEDVNSQKLITGPELENTGENSIPDNELLLVQGIIDAFFIECREDGTEGVVIVDYKTDKNTEEEHYINMYSPQLNAYKDAVEKSMGVKVIQEVIYSVELGKEIIIK